MPDVKKNIIRKSELSLPSDCSTLCLKPKRKRFPVNLSKNFTLEEMCATSTGVLNAVNDEAKRSLLYLCQYVLQPVRNEIGALKITSGYRSSGVNSAVGSRPSSQHLYGEAADFIPLGDLPIDNVYRWIVKVSGIPFGQCIRESKDGKDWIHISLPRLDKLNQQALIYDGKDYKNYV